MQYTKNDVAAARDAQKRAAKCNAKGCLGRLCRHSVHALPTFYVEVLKAEAEREERHRRNAERAKRVRFRIG